MKVETKLLTFKVRAIDPNRTNRTPTFDNGASTNDYDVICLTETKLVLEITEEAVFLLAFSIIRKQIPQKIINPTHGGVGKWST